MLCFLSVLSVWWWPFTGSHWLVPRFVFLFIVPKCDWFYKPTHCSVIFLCFCYFSWALKKEADVVNPVKQTIWESDAWLKKNSLPPFQIYFTVQLLVYSVQYHSKGTYFWIHHFVGVFDRNSSLLSQVNATIFFVEF